MRIKIIVDYPFEDDIEQRVNEAIAKIEEKNGVISDIKIGAAGQGHNIVIIIMYDQLQFSNWEAKYAEVKEEYTPSNNINYVLTTT